MAKKKTPTKKNLSSKKVQNTTEPELKEVNGKDVAKILAHVAKQEQLAKEKPSTNEAGHLVMNEYNEQTTLHTDGVRIYKYERDFSQFDSLSLYVMNDTHFGADEAQIEKVARYIQQIHDTPNGVLVLNGDIINFAIKQSVSEGYDANMKIREQVDKVIAMVEQMDNEGRILLNTWGNHDGNRAHKLVDVTPVDSYIKDKGKVAPAVALIRLKLKSKFKEGEFVHLNLLFQHGEAAKGGALGTVQSGIDLAVNIFNAFPDFVYMGHTHQSAGGAAIVFMPDVTSPAAKKALKLENRMKTRKQRIIAHAVSSGIITEVYAMKKGYKLANTEGTMFEFQQALDKDQVVWDENVIDMDLLYAIEHSINSKQRKELEKEYKKLEKDKEKYRVALAKLELKTCQNEWKKFEKRRDGQISRIMNENGITEEEL